jgi:hypothetical protein
MKSNYNKTPTIPARGPCGVGWDCITETLRLAHPRVVVVECYPGVRDDELLTALIDGLKPTCVINTAECVKCQEEIERLVCPDVTDDAIFGYLTRLNMDDFFDCDKLASARDKAAGFRVSAFANTSSTFANTATADRGGD